ncbi:hypothetical protein Tco_0196455 [Tanacetum coccineum]
MQGVKKDNVTYQPVKRKVDMEGSKGNSSEVQETGKVNNAVNESPSIRNKWNVNQSVLDSIRKSANKFFVLIDDPGEEGNDEDVNVVHNEEDDVFMDLNRSASKVARNEMNSSYASVLNDSGGRSGTILN